MPSCRHNATSVPPTPPPTCGTLVSLLDSWQCFRCLIAAHSRLHVHLHQVLWENLDTSSMGRQTRRLLTSLFALVLLISSFIALYHTQRLRQVRLGGP